VLHLGSLGLDFCVAWDQRNIWFLFCLLGYCGADIKSLCAEAVLCALRRRYPQIYQSSEKLQLDVASIEITAKDFVVAMQKTVPASQRAVASPGRALPPMSKPLLENTLAGILEALQRVFPHAELALEKNQQQGRTVTSTSLNFCQSKNFRLVQLTYTNLSAAMTVEFYHVPVHAFISGILCVVFMLDSTLKGWMGAVHDSQKAVEKDAFCTRAPCFWQQLRCIICREGFKASCMRHPLENNYLNGGVKGIFPGMLLIPVWRMSGPQYKCKWFKLNTVLAIMIFNHILVI